MKSLFSTKKDTTLFDDLIGSLVSVLIDHHKPNSNLKESYVGFLVDRKDGFLVLGVDRNTTNKITHLIVREDQVLSIWVYNESTRR